jgi:hypothetical protein
MGSVLLRRNKLQTGDLPLTGHFKSGPAANPGYAIMAQSVLFTETTGAGTYTGTVPLPAGSLLLDIIVSGVAVWDTLTSATMKVGDVADDDGYFTGVNLKATDLLAGEELSFAHAGGKAGADIANSQANRRYSAAARDIKGIITTVGATGSAGRTRMTVVYAVPGGTNVADGTAIAKDAVKS